MSKGVFIEGITVGMLWNASLEAVEDLINNGDMVDIEVNQTEWIPVSERLPKNERKRYWVCTDSGYQCECRWTNNRFGLCECGEWGWSIFDTPQYSKVVAWMPLPKPYREDSEA